MTATIPALPDLGMTVDDVFVAVQMLPAGPPRQRLTDLGMILFDCWVRGREEPLRDAIRQVVGCGYVRYVERPEGAEEHDFPDSRGELSQGIG